MKRGIAETRLLISLGLLAACTVGAMGAATARQAGEAPLPDRNAFLRNVRARLQPDAVFPRQYVFTLDERQVEFDRQGKVRKRTTKTDELYPALDDLPVYRRHLSVNGVPVPAAEVKQADDKRRKEVLDWAGKRERESAADRARRARNDERARAEQQRTLDEIFRVFDIRLVRRTAMAGRPVIEATLTPRPGVKPAVKDLSLVTKLKGRAWIDEQDYEIARVELETTDTISIGLGLLARVHKGTSVSFERRRLADGMWLPLRVATHAMARVALLKRVDTEVVTTFLDYRKFTVDTAVSFGAPAVK